MDPFRDALGEPSVLIEESMPPGLRVRIARAANDHERRDAEAKVAIIDKRLKDQRAAREAANQQPDKDPPLAVERKKSGGVVITLVDKSISLTRRQAEKLSALLLAGGQSS